MYKHIVIYNNIKQQISIWYLVFCILYKKDTIYNAVLKSFVYLFIGLFVYWIISHPAYAQILPQQNLRISPIIQNITLQKGQTETFPVTIENLADKPLGIHIDVFSFNPNNPEFANTTTEHSLTPWTTLSDTDVIVPEKSNKTIMVSIVVPQNASDGGYYETLAYTPFISNQQQIHAPILLSKFLGVVFASIGKTSLKDAAKKVTIMDFKPKAYIVDNQKETITFSVLNTYKTHVIGKPLLTITPLFENEKSFLLDEKYLFPGNTRTWEKQLVLPMHLFYKATLMLSVGQGNIVTATTWFILLPYKFVLACIVAIILLIITIMRKRIFKAASILLRG